MLITRKRISRVVNFLLLFCAGLISVFAYAPNNLVVVIVLSLGFLIFELNSPTICYSKKTAFWVGYIYGLGFFASQLYWAFYSLYVVIDAGLVISSLAFAIFIGFISLYVGLATLVFYLLKSKSGVINFLFLFPSIWVFFEWTRGWLFSGFPWSDISYTQVNVELFRGVYSGLGSYGVSLILLSIIGGIYLLLQKFLNRNGGLDQLSKNSSRYILIYFIGLFLVCNILQNQQYTRAYGKSISVGLIQGNISEGAKWNSDKFLSVYRNLIAETKADVVIIPETAISTFAQYLPKGYLETLITLANDNHAQLVVGIPKIIDEKNNYVNSATLLTNPKQPYYAKYHLVPFGEYIPFKQILGKVYQLVALPMVGFSHGSAKQSPLVIDNQKFAFNICYENGFNSELIENTKNATIMANLSDMVWYGNTIAKDEHLQISQARALENQRYFIQDTNTGLTAVINPQGEIQSQISGFKEAVLIDWVYGMVGYTPFERWGNYPVITFCTLMLVALLINRLLKK